MNEKITSYYEKFAEIYALISWIRLNYFLNQTVQESPCLN
jgi:hypothetical protein